jgi:hypothetical protein
MLLLSATIFPANLNLSPDAYAQDLDKPQEKKDKEGKIDSETLRIRNQVLSKKEAVGTAAVAEDIRVVLELDGKASSSKIKELTKLDVRIDGQWNNLLQVLVPAIHLEALANVDFVNYIRQPQYVVPTSISEGASFIGSDEINAAGFTGQDIKIAIIDIGFDLSNPEIAPNIVEAKSFRADGDIRTADPSHGTAVAEIILDVVPDAQLFLYNVDTDVSLLTALDYILDQQTVDIASMSLAVYNAGPYDGTSEISQAVNAVRASGILFVVAAGNEAQRHWEGNFVDPDSNGWRNFSGTDETIGISAQAGQLVEVYLSWDDWPVSTQDYDLYVLNDLLNIIAFSEGPQILGFAPRESTTFVAPYTGTYHIGIYNYSATQDVLFDLFTYPVDLNEYNVPSSSMTIPSDAAGALTVGAVFWENGQLEPFSSRGPTNDGRIKPDISAPDGVITSAFSPSPFYGTSAAAPHVAGAAALVKDIYPNADVDTIQLLLEENTLNSQDKNNDNGTGIVQVGFLLTVIPTANAGGNQTINENSTVILDGTLSTDSDGTIVSYLWEQVGGTITVNLTNASSSVASFTAPSVTADIELMFKLTVVDNLGASGSDTTTIVVKNINQEPIADAGSDQIVNEGDAVVLNATGSTDPEGDSLTYSWTQTAGPAVTLSGSDTATPSFTALEVDSAGATLTFELTVTDNDGLTSTDTVNVIVQNINKAPVADAGPDQIVDEGTVVILDGTGSSDPDGDPLTYSWLQIAGPMVTLSGTDTATPSFTSPEVSSTGVVLTFELTVGDGAAASTDTVNISIQNVNQPPVASAGPDQIVEEGDVVTLNGTASPDPDGDILSYSWEQIAGLAVILSDADTALPSFTAPEVDSAGATLTFELTVSDGIDNSTDTVDVVVNDVRVNHSPIADAGSNQTVNEGTVVTLNGTGSSDLDGDTLTYSWVQTAGSEVSLDDPISATPSFAAPSVDTNGDILTFELTVTDNDLLTSTDEVSVVIQDVNVPPIANAGTNQTVSEGDLVTLNGTATDDSSQDLTLSWTQLVGPSVVLSDITKGNATFTAPLVSADTLLEFLLTVTDADGAQASDTVSITILNVNQPPVANAGGNQTINENSTVILDGTLSTDSDGTIVSFSWAQTLGPSVALNNATIASPSFMAPQANEDSVLAFELTVSDNEGAVGTDLVTITVKNVLPSPPSGGSRGGGGGGSGGGARVVPVENASSPASFFLLDPLAKIIVQSTSFLNLNGVSILQAPEGQQIQISSTIQNQQQVSQTYVYIIQLLDENGVAVEINMHPGIIEPAQTTSIAKSWQSSAPGDYAIRVFIWDSVSDAPLPLAKVSERAIKIV